jgi:hypothetical protein
MSSNSTLPGISVLLFLLKAKVLKQEEKCPLWYYDEGEDLRDSRKVTLLPF